MSTLLYGCGNYEVHLTENPADKPYLIKNMNTGVTEHETRVLFEAIRYAKIFAHELERAGNFDPKAEWNAKTNPPTTLASTVQ